MELLASQRLQPAPTAWTWPQNDHTPIDITPYYVSKYAKGGLSYWVGAARSIGPTAQDWQHRRKAPIVFLLKVGSDAIHERLYYTIARRLNLPQQHVSGLLPHRIPIWWLSPSNLSQRPFFPSVLTLSPKPSSTAEKSMPFPTQKTSGVMRSYTTIVEREIFIKPWSKEGYCSASTQQTVPFTPPFWSTIGRCISTITRHTSPHVFPSSLT